jgi:hypothetical protein
MTNLSAAFSFLWLSLTQYQALTISGRLVYLNHRAEYLAERGKNWRLGTPPREA